MRKRMIGSLLSLTLLSLLAGCKQKNPSTNVFLGPDGNNLVAGSGEEPHHKLKWKLSDPKLTQFWIEFDNKTFCEEATDGILESNQGKITCTINSNQTGPSGYRIYAQDPRKHRPDMLPPVMYIYVGGPWGCPGC